MQIRILQAIASDLWAFYPGQIVAVDALPPGAEAWWTVPLADGSYRAEVVRPRTVEEAAAQTPEVAAYRIAPGRGRRR